VIHHGLGVEPGGLLHGMWQAADKAALMDAVEVIPWDDAVAMLPPDQPIARQSA
jgi:hypothetical protein